MITQEITYRDNSNKLSQLMAREQLSSMSQYITDESFKESFENILEAIFETKEDKDGE